MPDRLGLLVACLTALRGTLEATVDDQGRVTLRIHGQRWEQPWEATVQLRPGVPLTDQVAELRRAAEAAYHRAYDAYLVAWLADAKAPPAAAQPTQTKEPPCS